MKIVTVQDSLWVYHSSTSDAKIYKYTFTQSLRTQKHCIIVFNVRPYQGEGVYPAHITVTRDTIQGDAIGGAYYNKPYDFISFPVWSFISTGVEYYLFNRTKSEYCTIRIAIFMS